MAVTDSTLAVSASRSVLLLDGGGLPPKLGTLLRSLGYHVIVQSGVDQGAGVDHPVETLAGVVLDIQSPGDGALSTVAALVTRHPNLPIMTVGAVDQLKLLRRSIHAGAAEYVVTPTDYELLRRKCAVVFQAGRSVGGTTSALRSYQTGSHRETSSG